MVRKILNVTCKHKVWSGPINLRLSRLGGISREKGKTRHMHVTNKSFKVDKAKTDIFKGRKDVVGYFNTSQ